MTNIPSASSAGPRGRLTSSVVPAPIPISIAGISHRNSVKSACRHCRQLAFAVAVQSSAVTSGTANVSGKKCAIAGTAMIDEPKPVAPNIV